MPQKRNTFLGRSLRSELQRTLGYLCIREEQTAGEDAGTFDQQVWVTRELNTVYGNTVNTAADIDVTLPEAKLARGVYEVRASSPAHQVGAHQCRLYDVTNAAVLLLGTSEAAPVGQALTTRSLLAGQIRLPADVEVRLEHRCQTMRASDGMGVATGWATEVYAEIEFRRVG